MGKKKLKYPFVDNIFPPEILFVLISEVDGSTYQKLPGYIFSSKLLTLTKLGRTIDQLTLSLPCGYELDADLTSMHLPYLDLTYRYLW